MKKQFEPLFEEVTLRNGIKLPARFAMAPMVVEGSTYNGCVGEDDIQFFRRRSQTAPLLITGSAAVAPYGNSFGYGLGIIDDSYIPGLKQLASTMKADGAQAVLQIFHPGYQAKHTYKEKGLVYGPSDKQLPFLDYPMTGLSSEQVEEMIYAFGEATRRAIQAGFDGVEIHGANHYLIQQFFSPVTNERDDQWGGSLEKRAAFPLAVVKAVKDAVSEHATKPFIVGYRISPEEIHDDAVNYTLDDSLYLMNEVVELGVDYLHISLFGAEGYKSKAAAGEYEGEIMNQVIHDMVAGRTAHIVAGGIMSADAALDALNYADIAGLGTAVLFDPEFIQKIADGDESAISFDVADNLADLSLPEKFPLMINSAKRNGIVPQTTINAVVNKK